MSTTILSSPTTAAAAPRRVPFFRPEIDRLFDRLMMYDGKAEIIDGRIVIMSPAGAWHNFVSGEIFMSLHDYVRRVNKGRAITDNATFRVDLPHRESFSPDAAYHVGPLAKLGPYLAAPVFAAEVRSPGESGPRWEKLLADKREDYFACGTQVVWDVDLQSNAVVRVYRATKPNEPTFYHPGEIAEAEPAVPGWTVPVSELLPEDWSPDTTDQ